MTQQQKLVLWVSVLASFVAFLDGSVVNVALPTISRELGGGLSSQQWIVDGYMLTLGALMLLAGSLSDIFGHKRILTAGLLGFGAASILCAIAPSSTVLVLARLVQGVAGALLVPSSLALIMAAFSGKAQGRAIGSWTAWTGISFVIGPLLGGILVDSASWRLIFAINIVPIASTLYLMRRVAADNHISSGNRIDVLGAILCTLGLGAPVFALIEQPKFGWGSPLVLTPFFAGLSLFALFLNHEVRTPYAMLPLKIFRVRNFSIGNIATFSIYGGLSIATFVISIFLQQVGGYSAFAAGFALLPVTIVMFFLSPRFGAIAGKIGPKLFMAAGPCVAALGFLFMLRVGTQPNYWSELFPGVLIFALGLALTVAPLTSAVLADVDTRYAGIASATNNAISRIAGLIAVALVGLITGPHLTTSGLHRTLIATAVLMALGGLVSAFGIQSQRQQPATE